MVNNQYWIEGYFSKFWNQQTFYCNERDITIPMFAITNIEYYEEGGFNHHINGKVYIDSVFAEKQLDLVSYLLRENKFNWRNKKHHYLWFFCLALNTPYVKVEVKSNNIEVEL